MLHGTVCPVTVAVGIAGTGLAVYFARKADVQPSALKFSAVTAMVFALQMFNFSVQNGTSGHLMGSVLAMSLLGVPYAVISMAVTLTVQSVFFADGGLNALGANVINMAFIGVLGGGFLFETLKKTGIPKNLALALTAWLSVMAAATACSMEVAAAGTVNLNKMLPAMLSIHALIAVGEIAMTAVILALLASYQKTFKASETMVAIAAGSMAIVAAILSPFASNFPDGLEYVSQKLNFTGYAGNNLGTLFHNYQISFIKNEGFSTLCAGLVGIAIVFIMSQVTLKTVKCMKSSK